MHFIIARSDTVIYHITASTKVVVQDNKISTGDDCVSIVNGSARIKMKRIYCGPGHGISIGSLGQGHSTGTVTAVVLDTAFLKNTTNGLRIKTWQGGNGCKSDYNRSILLRFAINLSKPDISGSHNRDSLQKHNRNHKKRIGHQICV